MQRCSKPSSLLKNQFTVAQKLHRSPKRNIQWDEKKAHGSDAADADAERRRRSQRRRRRRETQTDADRRSQRRRRQTQTDAASADAERRRQTQTQTRACVIRAVWCLSARHSRGELKQHKRAFDRPRGSALARIFLAHLCSFVSVEQQVKVLLHFTEDQLRENGPWSQTETPGDTETHCVTLTHTLSLTHTHICMDQNYTFFFYAKNHYDIKIMFH